MRDTLGYHVHELNDDNIKSSIGSKSRDRNLVELV